MYAVPWRDLSPTNTPVTSAGIARTTGRHDANLSEDRGAGGPSADLMHLGARQLRDLLEQFTTNAGRCRTAHPPLEPSVLVNEVARRLLGSGGLQDLPGRGDFIAHLAGSFRHALLPPTAGGVAGRFRVSLAPCGMARAAGNREVARTLAKLERGRLLAAQITILRWFGGMQMGEIAAQLFREESSIATQWMVTKRWLSENLR